MEAAADIIAVHGHRHGFEWEVAYRQPAVGAPRGATRHVEVILRRMPDRVLIDSEVASFDHEPTPEEIAAAAVRLTVNLANKRMRWMALDLQHERPVSANA